MLNCFDLLICTSSFAMHFNLEDEDYKFYIDSILMVSVEVTYFITCLLSVRRLINLIRPLYLVKRITLNIAIAIFSIAMVAIEVVMWILSKFYKEEELVVYVSEGRCVGLLALICIIISSSLAGFIKLNKSYTQDQHRRTRYATVTVGILSAIFCFCNIGPLLISGLIAFHPEGSESLPPIVFVIAQSILFPLNSACNPVVYITRRSDMRTFLTTKCRGVIRYCKCGSEDRTGKSGEEVL